MERQVVLYEMDDGRAGIIYPAPGVDAMTAGRKSVRQGFPFVIVPDAELPASPVEREALVADLTIPDGHGENPYV